MSSTDDPALGQHKHNTLENFQPLVPTVSASHRLQHISTPQGSSASFGYIVARQWRADVASNRKTWAVVGTDVEAQFLYKDLIAGAVADTPVSSINRETILLSTRAGDCATYRRSGQLVIMPYSQLREVLFLGMFVDIPLVDWIGTLGGPTIVMDFNWGKVSFDMALSCSLIAKYVKASRKSRTNVFMACTVSDNNTTYFGEINQHIKAQQVMTPFDAHSVRLRFCEESKSREAFVESSEIEDGSSARGGRFLLVMDDHELPDGIMPQSLDSLELTSTGEAEYPLLDLGMSYVGSISNLRGVIIWPFTSAWGVCEGQSTRCFGPHRTARSQAEIHYYSRYMHGTVDPEAIIMQTEEEFNTCLPALCDDSPAHTVDLTALLVCCKLLWPRTAISKVPVYLPQDKQSLASQLQTLIMKRLLETFPEEHTPLDQSGLSILDTKTALTTTGKTTATLSVRTIDSPHGAHLLAQLLDPDGSDTALSQTSEAVVNTVLSLVAVTESLYGATIINETIVLQEDIRGKEQWYNTELYGVGAVEAWRGPIWLALSIWQKVRAECPFPTLDEQNHDNRLLLNNGELLGYLNLTLDWDTAFETAADAAKARGLDVPELSNTARLTAEEMLAVEKALVRAYLDKIIYVTDTGVSTFKAKHLLSGRRIRRPLISQARQVWWTKCQGHNAPLSRDNPCAELFFIYTHMRYEKDETLGDVASIPLDVTYVSPTAVELVLEEAGKLELMPGRHQEGTS